MNTTTSPEVIEEWWDGQSQMMGDDYLVEHEHSFEVDTHRETDRYVSYTAHAGVKALDVDGEVVTDDELLAELQAGSEKRKQELAEFCLMLPYTMDSSRKIDQWVEENPVPLRWIWDGVIEVATKDSEDDDYDNHDYDYDYTSTMFFETQDRAVADMQHWLKNVDPIRDLNL